MPTDLDSNNSRWGISGRAALIAVAIHIVIVVALLHSTYGRNFAAESDIGGGDDNGAASGNVNRKPVFHAHTLFVVNDTGAAIESARVRDLIADKVLVTPRSGTVTFLKRDGEIFMVRVTRPGYAPLRVRLPNEVSESRATVVRLKKQDAPR
jgi:hypothetical protein